MKTAHQIPRIGLARAKGDHLTAANDTPKPPPASSMHRLKDKDWKYTPSGATDIRALFKRIRKEQKKGGTK